MNVYCASDPVLPFVIWVFPQKQARRQECECSLLGKYRSHIREEGKAACTKYVTKPATAETSWSLSLREMLANRLEHRLIPSREQGRWNNIYTPSRVSHGSKAAPRRCSFPGTSNRARLSCVSATAPVALGEPPAQHSTAHTGNLS